MRNGTTLVFSFSFFCLELSRRGQTSTKRPSTRGEMRKHSEGSVPKRSDRAHRGQGMTGIRVARATRGKRSGARRDDRRGARSATKGAGGRGARRSPRPTARPLFLLHTARWKRNFIYLIIGHYIVTRRKWSFQI